MDELAVCLAAAVGSQYVSTQLSEGLHGQLPGATFLRASIRCGRGLFVTDDLLQPGPALLSVVPLRSSLAGVAMARWATLEVALPPAQYPPGACPPPPQLVVCAPAAAQRDYTPSQPAEAEAGGHESAANGCGSSSDSDSAAPRPLMVGALMAGVAPGADSKALAARVQALAACAAPYLLILSLTKGAEMAALLQMRASDCSCCGPDEEMQDLPLPAAEGGEGGCPPEGAAALAPRPTSAALKAAAAAEAAATALELPGANAAAEAALAGKSGLARGAAAADASFGAIVAPPPLRPGKCSSDDCCGAPLHHHSAAGELANGGGSSPKALLRLQQKQRQLGLGGDGGEVVWLEPPPALPLLLSFEDASLERRFKSVLARSLAGADLLFLLPSLVSVLCMLGCLDPGSMLLPATALYALLLAVPLLLLVLAGSWYQAHRERLLAPLLLSHALLVRLITVPRLMAAPTPAAPLLLRLCCAEALLPLGLKLRFRTFLPVHAAALSLLLSALLPLGAGAAPAGVGWAWPPGAAVGAAGAVVAGGILPALLLYATEARCRRSFLVVHQQQLALGGGGH